MTSAGRSGTRLPRRWFIGLAQPVRLVVFLALGLCTAASATDNQIEALRAVMADRLAIMIDVARYKWNEHIPVENLEREAVVLEETVAKAISAGVDPERAETLVRSQIGAAKAVQAALFETWQAGAVERFDDAPDLTGTLRPEISRLTADLIEALADAEPVLSDCSAMEVLAPVPESLDAFADAWAMAVAGVTDGPGTCG